MLTVKGRKAIYSKFSAGRENSLPSWPAQMLLINLFNPWLRLKGRNIIQNLQTIFQILWFFAKTYCDWLSEKRFYDQVTLYSGTQNFRTLSLAIRRPWLKAESCRLWHFLNKMQHSRGMSSIPTTPPPPHTHTQTHAHTQASWQVFFKPVKPYYDNSSPFSSGSEEFYWQCKNENSYTIHYVDSTAFNTDTLFLKIVLLRIVQKESSVMVRTIWAVLMCRKRKLVSAENATG